MKKILISDDSITVRKVIEMLLKPLNYDLLFAETGKDTLSKVMSEKFDLVIIDYSLPDVVGTQIAKEIKNINPLVPVLLMISSKEQEVANKLQEAMSDDLIEKPFDSQTFLNKIDALLKKSIEEVTVSRTTQEDLTVDINLDSIGIEFGEEFVSTTGIKETKLEEKSPLAIHELEENVKEEGLEEIEEIEEIEELGEEVLGDIKEEVEKVEEITIDELLKEDIENLSMVDTKTEEIDLSDLTIEEVKKEENVLKEEKTYSEEEKSINLEDFFADLNDILKEEKVENKAVSEKEMVKPVIEEVAKELKEIEMIKEKLEEPVETTINEVVEKKGVEKVSEEDIWNFDLDLSQKPLSTKESVAKPKLESKEIEDIVREITYDIVEKIAWEIVPEIVDTIMKDKFSKKS